ncbi:hypothetical protein BMF94_3246 [Rhodotorula taiwanensis]|uniref:Uncharacterized protein n=1 Tax=Rhodotorula taiwanensis TaxID=741276 RepID=A0A2S5BAB9_9BASI|nr:hypothetical protein BMF94_3246 [Rhodotorula taiwanensis]
MQRSQAARPPFNAATAGEALQQAFQNELEAVRRAGNGQGPKPELYAAKQAPAGPWGKPAAGKPASKAGAMANGQDFLGALQASLDKIKAAK